MELTPSEMIRSTAIVGLVALFAAVPFAAQAQPGPQPKPAACQPARPGETTFRPLAMTLAGEQLEQDAAKIWTDWEIWNPNQPQRTTIWQGVANTCDGQVIVSQIINRACSSATACPARVVFRTQTAQRVLLDYEQVCTLHDHVELRADLQAIRVCGQAFALATRTD